MQLTPPPKKEAGDYTPLPEEMHDVFIKDYEEKLKSQEYWKDPDKPEYQLEWTLVVRSDDEFNGRELKYWTGNAIGRHPKNKFTGLVKLVDSTFNIDDESTYFKSEDDFRKRMLYQSLRAVTTNTEKEVKGDDGETKTYVNAKIATLLKSSKPAITADEVAAMAVAAIGGTEVTDKVADADIPF